MVNFNGLTQLYPCGSDYGKFSAKMKFFFQTGGYRATSNISWCDQFPPPLALSTPAVFTASTVPQNSTKGKPVMRRRQIGIAFGGGSIHGIAHVGVLKAFAEKGLKFEFIAGTSAGAILGVLAAAQLPYPEIERIARRIEWPGVRSMS